MLLLTALLLAQPHADSTVVLKKCGSPVVPIGILFSAGSITVRLDGKGTPDTGSIAIQSMERGTPAGLRSALARQLPSCRFSLHGVDGAVRVSMQVRFDADLLRLSEVRIAEPGDSLGLPISPETQVPDDVVKFADPVLEERPANNCNVLIPRDAVTTTQDMARGIPPQPVMPNSGVVLMRYTVSAEGRVDRTSIQIDASPSPEKSRQAATLVSDCHWVPGRIDGRPVAVEIAQRQKI